MKVLVISHMFPISSEDNSGIFVQDQLLNLPKDCEIFVISVKPFIPPLIEKFRPINKNFKIKDKTKKIKNIKVLYIPYLHIPGTAFFPFEWISIFISMFRIVMKLQKEKKFDIIHSHTVLPDGLVGLIYGILLKIPTICTAHGSDINIYPFRDKISLILSKFVIKNTCSMVYVSNALKNKANYIALANNQVVINNGYDPAKFSPMGKVKARKMLNLSEKPTIVFVGNFLEVKGVKLLIPILEKILEKIDNIQLISIGSGDLKNTISIEVTAKNLNEKFLFFDRQPHELISYWINAADLIIMPSISEGFPTLIPEVLACGRPIVAFNVGGIPEIINDEIGFLVPVGDISVFSKKVILALNKQWDTKKIIKLGQKYSWYFISEKYYELYKKLTFSLE